MTDSEFLKNPFLKNLRRSEIVESDVLANTLEELQSEFDTSKITDQQLVDRFVNKRLITAWQSKKLLRGRYKGFFLGKYKLLDHLGTGGMSTVYLAEHILTRQKRAIKVLPRKKTSERSYLARFYREGRAVAALNHPNIVRIYDIEGENDTHYMVMEFVEGSDLFDIVTERGPVDFELAKHCVVQSATGLAHAHENNIVHRDIKPANLLLTNKNTVKVLDLGLALETSNDDQFRLSEFHNESTMGTADFLAPEQAVNAHQIDHRADIYSLGCTLYYLLTGRPPFDTGTIAQRIAAHQNSPAPSIFDDRSDCPPYLESIYQKMVCKDPNHRFQNCNELIKAIQTETSVRVAHSSTNNDEIGPTKNESKLTTSVPKSEKKSEISVQKKKRGNTAIAVLAFALALACGLAFVVIRKSIVNSGSTEIAQPADVASNTIQSDVPANSPVDLNSLSNQNTKLNRNPGQSVDQSAYDGFESINTRRERWEIRNGNRIVGTLLPRRKGKIVEAPVFASGESGGQCLRLPGNSNAVEFRPINKNQSVHSIKFTAAKENPDPHLSLQIQAKSWKSSEKWKTVFTLNELEHQQFTDVVVSSKRFEAIDSRKFRFKIDGVSSAGVYIDNLYVELVE